MSDGIAVSFDGRRVALKWHRLRRRMSDRLFDAGNLGEGLRLGASMEVDLRVTRDGNFAVLHDDALDGETDGKGPVSERDGAEIAALCYRDRHGTGRRVLMLDDFVQPAGETHPEALLQIDMKDGWAETGQARVSRLVQALSGSRLPLIVSGDSIELIMALAEALPGLRRGIDPTDRLVELFRTGDARQAAWLLQEELLGPAKPDMVYLAWQLLLNAREAGIDLVEICHDAGKTVDAWTYTLSDPAAGFNDREWREFSTLLQLGVDQITTDEALATERAFETRTTGSGTISAFLPRQPA